MSEVGFFWSAISGFVVVVTWFIRLEAKVLYLERDHAKLVETSQKTELLFQTKIDRLGNDLNDIKVCLARIESRIFIDDIHKPRG